MTKWLKSMKAGWLKDGQFDLPGDMVARITSIAITAVTSPNRSDIGVF
jgi:hypothetical protein